MAGRAGAGWGLALLSSACFSTSGSFGTPLIHAGWSPGAAVAARIGIAGLVLAAPAAWSLRGRWHLLRRNAGTIAAYGLIAVAGCQLFYFNALETLTVGVALLLEYLGVVMVVAWLWIRHHQRPGRLTVAGAGVAIAGLVLVLDVFGGAVRIDLVGVAWGLAAAAGLAVYFMLSAKADGGAPPLVLASGGLLTGAAALGLLGLVRAVPLHAATADVLLAGYQVPWYVPILGLSLIAAAAAYVAGIGGMRILGPKLGSFVSLAEVLFAVLFAWVLLGQLPAPVQLGGGALIVCGVALVRADEIRRAGGPRPADRLPADLPEPDRRAASPTDQIVPTGVVPPADRSAADGVTPATPASSS